MSTWSRRSAALRIWPVENDQVIGAFSEEQASLLTGVSMYQLRQWDREGFFNATYAAGSPHIPYGRLYSFRDLVSLQVLNDLRNIKGIPLPHLKEVSKRLDHLGDTRWTSTTLYVLGKRVVLEDVATQERVEVVSGQRVLNIPLRVVIRSTRAKINEVSNRESKVGDFERNRFVSQNERVFAGTRIAVAAVVDFHRAGYSADAILQEFPALVPADIEAAIRDDLGSAAA